MRNGGGEWVDVSVFILVIYMGKYYILNILIYNGISKCCN